MMFGLAICGYCDFSSASSFRPGPLFCFLRCFTEALDIILLISRYFLLQSKVVYLSDITKRSYQINSGTWSYCTKINADPKATNGNDAPALTATHLQLPQRLLSKVFTCLSTSLIFDGSIAKISHIRVGRLVLIIWA